MATAAARYITYAFDRFTIDRDDERLFGPFGPIRIGHKAFQVLLALIEQRGRLVTKDTLMSTVWDGRYVSESVLTAVIKELRRALGDDARTPQYIENVYGRGYRLVCEVDFVNENRGSSGTGGFSPPIGREIDAGTAQGAAVLLFDSFRSASRPEAANRWDPRSAVPAAVAGAARPFAPYRRLANRLVAVLFMTSVLAMLPTGPIGTGGILAPAAIGLGMMGR